MKILITGGLGFIGRKLSVFFLQKGHCVATIGLRSNPPLIDHKKFRYISADTTRPGDWQQEIALADVVVNLAGKSLFHRWTEQHKQQMRDSRILTTRHLVEALPEERNITLISTSAVGYYGDGKDRILSEEAPAGEDFLAGLSLDWESEARQAEKKKNARVVIPRFGIVLDADGGAMDMMIMAFRWFLGGKLGDGEQWFPWIHMTDLVHAYGFLLENPQIRGAINFCAPYPVQNKELTQTLAGVLKRPAFMPAPAFMIKLVLGELGKMLLNSQRVVPQRLLDYGYEFEFPSFDRAVAEIVQRRDDAIG